MHDLRPRNGFLSVAAWNVARPKSNVLEPCFLLHPEKNNRMTVLGPADFRRPKNFHKVAGLRLGEVVEVFAEVHFVEEESSARAIGVPSHPDAFAIELAADKETFTRDNIQPRRSGRDQR